MSTRKNLCVESLEDRRMLAIVIAGENYNPPGPGAEFGYVAPPQSGFSPIALPNGITPPGAAELSPPPGGELPPGMPQFSGFAQTNASALAVGWMYTHQDAVGDVTESIGANKYNVTLDVRQGADFFQYGVAETAAEIAARYVVRDGAHSEILASYERTGPLDGGLVYAQFDHDLLTAMAVHSEIAGVDSVWGYPELAGSSLFAAIGADAAPGLGSLDDLAALDALVSAHLSGPASAQALESFRGAVDEYFSLAVPEPSALMLAAAALPFVVGWWRKKVEQEDSKKVPGTDS
ncbi:MAG: hypothetical protein IT427_07590 [Pirellulales bacterium]|nr:hypothetical protein [Pirellulales bacterium]